MATLPSSFSFRVGNPEQITWTLTDSGGNPVSGVGVTASLYVDRNLRNFVTTPGTIDPVFNNISLSETPASSGIYIGVVPATFNPVQSTFSYVTVITAAGGALANPITWQIPSVVVFPENVIDLIDLDQVKAYIGMKEENTNDDGLIQALITGFSQYVMHKTGRTAFNQIKSFVDTFDGNGNQRLFMREFPIVTLTSVVSGLYSVPISTSFGVPGVFVEDSRKSIAFRTSQGSMLPPQSIYPYYFPYGQGNIVVTYTAGYAFVPFDLQEACMKAVSINYKRKDWIDIASKSLAAGSGVSGSIRYRDWSLPPEVEQTILFYKRRAVV